MNLYEFKRCFMPRGGARPNSGPESAWNYSPTKAIRVPAVLADELLHHARKLDRSDSDCSDRQQLAELIEGLASDATVTRQGKDSGAVRRALRAVVLLLQEEGVI